MEHFSYLIKQACVGLSARKGFLVSVVTTLGITLGALLCVLTLFYVLIAKPLPYPEQEHLYQVNAIIVDQDGGDKFQGVFTYPSLIHLFDNQTVFSQSALVSYESGVLSSLLTQPAVNKTFVTPSWFALLGSEMSLGRTFEETEDKDSYHPVAILSYEFWQNEFNADSTILEQTVTLGSTNFRVVGVLAKTFIEPQLSGIGINSDIFLPWDYNGFNLDPARRESHGNWNEYHRFVGKLDSQLSIPQVEQTLTTPSNRYWRENISENSIYDDWSLKLKLQPFKHVILSNSQNTVLLLLAGVIALILIACTNITNLFMSRTADQQRQLAIMAAVGASKRQLFQALLAQSGVVVFMSVVVALIVASTGFWVLQHYLALRLPRVNELAINSVTLGAALFIALLLGLFFARISASMINYRALNATLQSSGKGTGIQVSPRVRQWLITSQVTIVTLLVFVNIGLLGDSLKVINKPLGFETENISTLRLKVGGNLSAQQIKPLSLELKSKLMALPQVEDVSLAPSPLGSNGYRILKSEATEQRFTVISKYIDDRYFHITGQTLIEGDFFSPADFNNDNELIIINDVWAAKLAPNGSALGKRILAYGDRLTVSGVVKSVKMPTETDIPMRAYMRNSWSWDQFTIKLKPQQTFSREFAVTVVQEVSRQFFVSKLETLNDQRDKLLFTQYTTAITSAALAVLTFFLATIGLYGILNYTTQMRRFELGTRIALGAKRMDVIGLIIKDNAGCVGIGIVISLVLVLAMYIGFSEALASYINQQLITLFFVTLVLISSMAFFACYWPLRSIINFPPIRSLRGSD